MKIIELTAQNVQKIKAIEIKPKKDVVFITGKNDQGKSIVIDLIWMTLKNRLVTKEIIHPIREGEKFARASLLIAIGDKDDRGDLIPNTVKEIRVTRHWTAQDKSYLKVEAGKNFVATSPQELINTLVGELAFDPLEFARKNIKEQRDLLLKMIHVDLNSINRKSEEIYTERTLTGRDLKNAEAQQQEVPDQDKLPGQEVIIASLSEKLEKAVTHNQKIEQIKQQKTTNQRKIELQKEFREGYRAEIRKLKQQIESCNNVIINLEDEQETNKIYLQVHNSIDTTIIKEQIKQAEEINQWVRIVKRNKEYYKQTETLRSKYEAFTTQLRTLEDQKQKMLADAKMPIEELAITDEGITYQGFPFEDLSDSVKFKVSLAIMMALNPKLRVITMKNGSILDSQTEKEIAGMVKDKDFQAWIEKVDETGKIGFYIEDGELITEN